MFLHWTGALLTYKRTDDDLLDNPPGCEPGSMCMYLRDGAVTAIVLTGGYYYCSYTFFSSPSCYDPAGTVAQR